MNRSHMAAVFLLPITTETAETPPFLTVSAGLATIAVMKVTKYDTAVTEIVIQAAVIVINPA
jgi:hypothetical protein